MRKRNSKTIYILLKIDNDFIRHAVKMSFMSTKANCAVDYEMSYAYTVAQFRVRPIVFLSL